MKKQRLLQKLAKELSNWYDYKVTTLRKNKFGKTTDIVILADKDPFGTQLLERLK